MKSGMHECAYVAHKWAGLSDFAPLSSMLSGSLLPHDPLTSRQPHPKRSGHVSCFVPRFTLESGVSCKVFALH